jgi:dihydrolipoamide dehydrogenase
MTHKEVDVAVIGAGTAGLAAYRAATAAGRRAVLVEGGPYGTTCARVGCMPSKLLIAAAEAAHGATRWDELGLHLTGPVTVDGRAVMSRVKRERDRFVGFVLDGVEAIPAGDRVRGHARFIDDASLAVDDRVRIDFAAAVIATGSSPSVPEALRAAGDRLVVNDDIFEWDDLPRSVAVFGPGVIGLELGLALSRLGVEVSMFGRRGHVGPFTDPLVRAYAARIFAQEFELEAHAEIRALGRVGNGVALTFRGADGGERTARIDHVIAATGRTPNVAGLDLARTSIALDPSGIPLFDRTTMQCGTHPIFIAGDASDDVLVLHEAADEGRIAGENAARYPDVRPALRRTPLAIVFTDPGIAVVGARHADLAPESFVTGVVSFSNQGRSRIMLRNRGLLHVYAEIGTGRLLGAEMIAPDAEHLGHLVAWAIAAEITISRRLEMPFYHPVVEEGLRSALRDASAKLRAAGKSAPDPASAVDEPADA